MTTQKFTHLDDNGQPWGIVHLQNLWTDNYAILFNRPEIKIEKSIWLQLFLKAKESAIRDGAKSILVRARKEYEYEKFKTILEELNFIKKSGRIEYQAEIQNLPSDSGTPFVWKTAKELNWSNLEIALFTKEIVKDALDINPDEKPEDFISDWLQNKELTFGKECISIGFINNQTLNQPVALVVAQVEQKTGWSRISYMGLIPQYRRKNLGTWIHRRGFEMMKAQNGILYHGGTHIDNFAMRKLFEIHGCRLFTEMTEWEFITS